MIADAVIDIGFANASLTAVAQHLGVGHGALYRYIGDRNGMMRAALERLTGRFEWPDLVDDWREVLWNESRAWWTLCERHPGFVTVLAPTPGMPTPMSRRSMRLAVHLHGLGLVGADSLLVVDLVTDTIHDIFHRFLAARSGHRSSADNVDRGGRRAHRGGAGGDGRGAVERPHR